MRGVRYTTIQTAQIYYEYIFDRPSALDPVLLNDTASTVMYTGAVTAGD